MVDDNDPSRLADGPLEGGSADAIRRSRTPPTLDLQASRSQDSQVQDSDFQASDLQDLRTEASGAESFEARNPTASHSGEAPSANQQEPEDQINEAPKRGRAVFPVNVVVSAVAGAGGAILIGGAMWLAGWAGESNPRDVEITAAIESMTSRLAQLEAAASARAAADKADHSRLDAVEKSLRELREEMAAARAQNERTAKMVDEVKSVPANIAPAPSLSGVEDRFAQLDAKTQALERAQASDRETKANPGEDLKLKRVVAATSLDLAVRQGEPFASALDVAKQLGGDAGLLKPLDSFATRGVPSVAELSRDLLALLPQLEGTPATAPSGSGWLDRLQASAARLVKIRRSDAVDGNDTAAIISRAAAAARRNDLAEAKRELNALPQPDRARVQPWMDKKEARDAALAASRQFAANAMTALTKSAP